MTANTDVAIFTRLVEPENQMLVPAAARYFLALEFRQEDRDRMHQLSAKARAGTLTADEQAEIDNYERVGHLLSILKSKARKALKKSRRGA